MPVQTGTARTLGKLLVPLSKKIDSLKQGDKVKDGARGDSVDATVAAVVASLNKGKFKTNDETSMEIRDILDKESRKKDPDAQNRGFWNKILKSKHFDKLGKGITDINKGIKKLMDNSLISFLIGLALLAMFDPDGTFLISLLEMFMGFLFWAMNAFIDMIPAIVNFLVVAVPKIAKALAEAFVKLISFMWKSLMSSKGPLEFIIKAVLFLSILAWIFGMVGGVIMWVVGIGAKIVGLFTGLGQIFLGLGKIIGFLFTPLGLVILAFLILAGVFIYLWKTNETFRNGIIAIWEKLKNTFKKLWSWILGGDEDKKAEKKKNGLWSKIKGFFSMIGDAFATAWNWLWTKVLKPGLDALWSFMKMVWKFIEPVVMPIIRALQEAWKKLMEVLGPVFETIGKMLKGDISFGDGMKKIGDQLSAVLMPVWLKLAKIMEDLWQSLKNKYTGLFGSGTSIKTFDDYQKSLSTVFGKGTFGDSDKDVTGAYAEIKKLDLKDIASMEKSASPDMQAKIAKAKAQGFGGEELLNILRKMAEMDVSSGNTEMAKGLVALIDESKKQTAEMKKNGGKPPTTIPQPTQAKPQKG